MVLQNVSLCIPAYSVLVVPLLVFLVLLTNKLDSLDRDKSVQIRYFSVCSPLYLTFFTLIVASFGSRGGNQYWFGLRKPPCQFLFGVCPCLQLFGNISYSLYSNGGNNSNNGIAGTAQSGNPASTPGTASSSSMESSPSADISVVGTDAGELSEFHPGHLLWGGSGGEGGATGGRILHTGSKKKSKKNDQIVVPALTLEMPD